MTEHGHQLTFPELFVNLNKADNYYPFFQTKDFILFWENFLIALVNNLPVTLIDSDLNHAELAGLGIESEINKPIEISPCEISSIDEFLELIKTSESPISLYTSGTTGQPKCIQHTVSTLTRSVRQNVANNSDVWGFAYNPTHMAGLQVFFHALLNLNTIINLFESSKDSIYRLIGENKITHISATPTFYRLLMPPLGSLNTVQRVTLGGEKSDIKLIGKLKEIFSEAKIANIYASTEAGSLFISRGEEFTVPDDIKRFIGFDNDELLVHKSLVGKSDHLVLENDFYKTGDLVEWVDKEAGIFKIKSRKNELINIGGYKVNPSEVEEYIYKITEVAGAVVFGKSNSVLGNILCADVKLYPDTNITESHLRQFLQSYLQDFKIPRRIRFVDELNLTRTGKLKRS